MTMEVILNPNAQKHLIAKALIKRVDFSKRVYIAYGLTNYYLLYHLGIKLDKLYVAGCFRNNKIDVNDKRPEIVILENRKIIDIKDFEIEKEDYFIKGANALWYENNNKFAAVAVADKKGGTYGNFYIKAAAIGANVIIPVTHEKLIPSYEPATQNVDIAMGNKIAMFRFFYGEIFTEIEAFSILFGADAKIIASGGILGSEGSLVFIVEGEREIFDFINHLNNLKIF
jgi:hypothetical protein